MSGLLTNLLLSFHYNQLGFDTQVEDGKNRGIQVQKASWMVKVILVFIHYPEQDWNYLSPKLHCVTLHYGLRLWKAGALFLHFSPFNFFWSCPPKRTRVFGKVAPVWNWMPLVMCTHHQKPAAQHCWCGGPYCFLVLQCCFNDHI